jgi:hypothetical protein
LEVNPPNPLDVLIHLLLSETFFSPLPLRMAEISSVRGVWMFSGTTLGLCIRNAKSAQYRKDRANIEFRLPQNSATVCLLMKQTVAAFWGKRNYIYIYIYYTLRNMISRKCSRVCIS